MSSSAPPRDRAIAAQGTESDAGDVTVAAPAGGKTPRKRRRSGVDGYTVLRWLSPFLLLAVWQICSTTGVLPEDKLDAPSTIARTAWDLWQSGVLGDAVLVSLQRAAIGFAIGGILAVVLGTWVALTRLGDAIADPIMQMLRAIPLFGLVPLFIIWFGIKEEPKIYLVALGVMIPLYLNLVAALRGVDPDLKELATTLRLTRLERIRHVLLPSVLPGTLVGLRQSLGAAWIALVVAEQVNAGAGLGYMITNARDFYQPDVVVVGLLTYAVLGLLTDAIVRVLERRALRWRDEGRLA
ncbi:ABC transporter permease [Nocardioides yefusunii]|uniref:ABC transporter permease n=1 Tax=Nocardioides yefusunii TaxID=2500546 RepID=A0ABW1QX25_9ACTN|nr:ABC transporter permease [Nocardioides yefusunii]